jgi:hypothetical protein
MVKRLLNPCRPERSPTLLGLQGFLAQLNPRGSPSPVHIFMGVVSLSKDDDNDGNFHACLHLLTAKTHVQLQAYRKRLSKTMSVFLCRL